MTLITAKLQTPVGFDTKTGVVRTEDASLRYADKNEVVAVNVTSVIQDLYLENDIQGIPGGSNHLTERKTRSKAGIVHHNIRVKMSVPSFTVVTGPKGATAKAKMEDVTVSVSVSLPSRIKNDPALLDTIEKMVANQIHGIAAGYGSQLADLLV